MRYHADLHIHSKYSRATSRDLDLEHLAYWARKKGVAVVGTGDFTHPKWRAEIREQLVPAEPGLFRLRDDLEARVAAQLPTACHGVTRFMLSVEISTIYKKGDATRKIHHLIYVPDFEAAERFSARLAHIGNIVSDGRPILGLDSRNLLEIVLEASPDAYLVPAHIWTPWFAVLGSRSGFDNITDCYADLSPHIFAVETGLSSDPEMNWRISFLDRFRLVSNSDAHSPAKLGRKATLFDTELSYFGLRRALETGNGYVGTVEFFPEEGKYHLDGHRKCRICWTPEETQKHNGRCPVCGQPVTVGVMHRVHALADRPSDSVARPETGGRFINLVPLPEILSEINASGVGSQKVERNYERLVSALGAELPILEEVPVEDIARADSSLLAEAITRLRQGKVIRDAGYDGEYGVIRLFEEAELRRLTAGGVLFSSPLSETPKKTETVPKPAPVAAQAAKPRAKIKVDGLDEEQRQAVSTVNGPLLIVAGPGSGKTRTLTHRIAALVGEHGVAPEACLAITFTRRAAAEMAERLKALVPDAATRIPVHTFHSLGLAILREHPNAAGLQRGFHLADETERTAALAEWLGIAERKARDLLPAISRAKRTGDAQPDELAAYQDALCKRNWIDFDDLISLAAKALVAEPGLAARYRFISVDEFQDLDAQQYELIRLLAPMPSANLCVIGDPNQAIYGFRGADATVFQRFAADYPVAATVRLTRNYRSSGTIFAASAQVIDPQSGLGEIVRDLSDRITIHAAPTERAKAEFVVSTIEKIIGGHSFFSIDSGRAENAATASLSFSDFAVLYRTHDQLPALREAFSRSGMPFRQHSHELLVDQPVVRALLAEFEKQGDGPLAASLTVAARRMDVEEAGQALQLLTALAESCGGDRQRFLDALPLATEADLWDPRADRVSLLTLHGAKGLEFPVVFIVGLEEGVLPFSWGRPDEVADDEERRLFYVGLTRAKDRLFLSRAVRRRRHGRLMEMTPSRYLGAIEKELLEHSRARAAPRRAENRQLDLL
jgi:DNA helicase-2/ATP-dependent DNA helicase PcrA